MFQPSGKGSIWILTTRVEARAENPVCLMPGDVTVLYLISYITGSPDALYVEFQIEKGENIIM